jgi:hypothetical protein
MTMTDPVRILFGSDFHFGIPSVSQEDMAIAFVRTIFPLLEETDVFFINGDFFDTLVSFDNYGFDPIYDTIVNLFQLCERRQITLRILQGTYMHDRDQGNRFTTIYRNGGFGGYTFNFRFMRGIDLEELHFGDRSLRVVYVQDDLPFTDSNDVVDVIRTKLVELGWDSVDYACMHGFFDHTAGGGMSREKTVIFTEDQFPFVKKIINCGHVHQYGAWDKLISNGSFDRAVFGDEAPKGLVKVLDYPDHYTAQFIENKWAAVYDTLAFSPEDTTETLVAKISAHIASLTSERKISLRFIVDPLEHREAIKVWMREAYPDIRFQFKKNKEVDDKSIIVNSSVLFAPVEKRPAPNPETLPTFIRAYIPDHYQLSVDAIKQHLLPLAK